MQAKQKKKKKQRKNKENLFPSGVFSVSIFPLLISFQTKWITTFLALFSKDELSLHVESELITRNCITNLPKPPSKNKQKKKKKHTLIKIKKKKKNQLNGKRRRIKKNI